ncbi:cytochrome P450 6a2-like [Uranotaenia lowii]|uniref:cytochrome P450 6a2-like n=1 Tax=Uranotaenia lowii TaxID=190385 RepID=UPI0024797F77|nr:cytochrome P450 6a2-like [Uranotaenia lowii]
MAFQLLLTLVVIAVLCIAYVKKKYSYWANYNVPYLEPEFPFGNFKEANHISMADMSTKQYRLMKDKGPFFGMYFFLRPLIMVTDLDLIKTILIKDFSFFPDRGTFFNHKDDPISAHLFAVEGNYWRTLRTKLTPTFTSGKMKLMYPTLKAVGNNFADFLEQVVDQGKELEVKDCMARLTVDIIGSCAFGIECNSFSDPDSRFRKFGTQVFDKPRHRGLVRLFLRLFPEVGRSLRIKAVHDDASDFFRGIVKDTVEYRQQNGSTRKDFLNLLLELKHSEVPLSMDEIAAQSFIFFIAGFETSSSNQTYCLYELALNQDCQDKARKCVKQAIEKHGGLTYEAVCDMAYLDQCINETLRLYPSVPVLERKAFKDYKMPNSKAIIPKGMKVQIPAFAIHRDESIYPNPMVFDPDRFSPEEVANRHPCAFLPFGEGPRICIGLRFGMLQSRVGLATVLNSYRVTPCSKTTIPLEYSSTAAVLQPKGAVWLRFEPL